MFSRNTGKLLKGPTMDAHTIYITTRMHSSRMRTVCCSRHWGDVWPGGCLVGVSAHRGVCPGGVCLGGCLPRQFCPGGCIPSCTGWQGVCPNACWDTHTSPVDRILDTCLWRHYLSTTTLPIQVCLPRGVSTQELSVHWGVCLSACWDTHPLGLTRGIYPSMHWGRHSPP